MFHKCYLFSLTCSEARICLYGIENIISSVEIHLKSIKRHVCVCSARLDHQLLVLWHFRAVGFLYVQNILTALSLISQGDRVFEHEMKTNYYSYTFISCFLEQDGRSGDKEQTGYEINHWKVEAAGNMQEGEHEK